MSVDTELVAYTTDEADIVHAVVWADWPGASRLVLFCTTKIAGRTRTSVKAEPVTCLACIALLERA